MPGLERLLRQQGGAVSRSQLRTLGVGERAVTQQLAAERWQAVGPLVVVLHTGELTVRAQRWAAVLSAPRPRALAAWTALEVHGLRRWERGEVHLLVPRGATPAPLAFVRVHESRRFTADDVELVAGLAVTSAERSAVDAGAWASSARAAGGVLAATVQQRLSSAARLEEEVRRTRNVKHRGEMLAVLADVAGGSQSMAEVDVVRVCRRHGLPKPDQQRRRKDSGGRTRYLDVLWTLPDGRRVLLEVDGGMHAAFDQWADDGLRAAEVSRPGETVLRLSAHVIRTQEARVVAALRRHLVP